jgi:hypothetical protein
VTRQRGPVGRGLAFLDPLLRRPALVVEANDGPVRLGQRGDDEPDPGEQLAEVMLDLGDDAARAVPGGLVLGTAVADQGRVIAPDSAAPGTPCKGRALPAELSARRV